MENKDWIEVSQLCRHYQVDVSFLNHMDELGIVKFTSMKTQRMVHHEDVRAIEKAIRLHQDLKINLEGIDVIFNLLDKITTLQQDLTSTKNQLRIYIED